MSPILPLPANPATEMIVQDHNAIDRANAAASVISGRSILHATARTACNGVLLHLFVKHALVTLAVFGSLVGRFHALVTASVMSQSLLAHLHH